jgi:Na+-transporting NADH:ubiquinone oxidoreductase subunit C
MRKADRQLFTFALVVCVVISALLSTTASVLKEQQDRMIEMDRKRNVLIAFGVDMVDDSGAKLTGEQMDAIFSENISEVIIDAATGEPLEGVSSADVDPEELRTKSKLPLYKWTEDGEITKVAFPISGPGLWSVVYGFVALQNDLATIAGITFYKHGETPGLGAEVEKEWFTSQFPGKKLYDNGAPLEFEVVKGGVERIYPDGSEWAVDGISGATITASGVAAFLNSDFRAYNKYFETIRG